MLLLPLLFSHTTTTVWLIYLIAFLLQMVGQFFSPAAAALLPTLVAKEDLPTANAWCSLGSSFTLLAGPALGGYLLGTAGWSSIIIVDIVSFLLSALLMGYISVRPDQLAAGIVGQLGDVIRRPSIGTTGWRYANYSGYANARGYVCGNWPCLGGRWLFYRDDSARMFVTFYMVSPRFSGLTSVCPRWGRDLRWLALCTPRHSGLRPLTTLMSWLLHYEHRPSH